MTKKKYILPLVAIVGVLIAIAVIIENNRPAAVRPFVTAQSISPYPSYITGVGIVESSTGNIAVGTPVSGIVAKLYVKVGDNVERGDALFKIDDSALRARLPTASAAVKVAEVALQKPRHHLQYAEKLIQRAPDTISKQSLSDLRDNFAKAEASYKLAKAEFKRLKMEIARYVVHAPLAGTVLKLHVRKGEYAESSGANAPVMQIGGNNKFYVRTNIDENDSWRLQPGAAAVAFVAGNPERKIPLRFEYVEPLVIAKTSLTGKSTERTDRRVLQVIFSFERGKLPIYAGQRLDVFIQIPSAVKKNKKEAH